MSLRVTFIYLAALLVTLWAQQWVGQLHPASGAMLFLPPQLWIAPALVLAPVFLLRASSRRAGIVLAVVSGWYFLFYLGPQANRQLPREPGDLTIVSWNAGVAAPDIIKPFVQREAPDIILLQEVNGRYRPFARAFPGYKMRAVDEFLMLSKLPVSDVRVIELQTGRRGLPCAGRFVVDHHGTSIAIYNVHLPTLRGLLKPQIANSQQRSRRWRQRVVMTDELVAIMNSEPLPLLAVGDFNTPNRGPVYRRLTVGLQDAHRQRGQGYGFTLPGYRSGLKGLIGPWLRLDHAFANTNWEVCSTAVMEATHCQHRAISVRVRQN